MKRTRVAVVGAGIVGLSAGAELTDAGCEVRVYDPAPTSLQSTGLTRIFRLAHTDARLVELACRALEGWHAWEEQLGRTLVGRDGLLITDIAPEATWGRAMADAGAPARMLTPSEARARFPGAALGDEPILFDEAGGATRVHRTTDFLMQRIGTGLHRQSVDRVEPSSGSVTVVSGDGAWECDEVVIAAGVETVRLAAPLGLDIPQVRKLHSRFTFPIRPELRGEPFPCWIDAAGRHGGTTSYGQPVGTTGNYALGESWEGQDDRPEVGAEEVSRQSAARAVPYVEEVLPGLEPRIVAELRCTFPEYAFSEHGDGFMARRDGHVTAFYGNNLFKFAPLIGRLLCDSMLKGELSEALRKSWM